MSSTAKMIFVALLVSVVQSSSAMADRFSIDCSAEGGNIKNTLSSYVASLQQFGSRALGEGDLDAPIAAIKSCIAYAQDGREFARAAAEAIIVADEIYYGRLGFFYPALVHGLFKASQAFTLSARDEDTIREALKTLRNHDQPIVKDLATTYARRPWGK